MRNLFILLLITCLLSSGVKAWGTQGHLIIAQIAFDQLSDDALQRVHGDLKGFNQFFPQYSNPLAAASWSDMIRGFGVETFTTWHYIDLPYNPTNVTIPHEISDVNIRWALNQVYDTLQIPRRDTNAWTRNFMLRFLMHLAGDLHQPFHNTEYYSAEFPEGDQGGNLISVWYGWKYMSLHGFWDKAGGLYTKYYKFPLTDDDVNEIRRVARKLIAKHSEVTVIGPNFEAWSNEVHRIAVEFGYPDVLNERNLTEDYINKTREYSEQQ